MSTITIKSIIDLLQTNEITKATDMTEQFLLSHDGSIVDFFMLGDAFVKSQSFAQAERIYQKILSDSPNDIGVMGRLGDLALKQGEAKQSAAYFEQIIDNPNPRAWAYIGLGNALERLQEFEGAIKNFEIALNISDEKIELLKRIANLMKKTGRLEDALNYYIKIVGSDADTAYQGFMGLSKAAQESGNNELAKKIVRAIITFFRPDLLKANIEKNRDASNIVMADAFLDGNNNVAENISISQLQEYYRQNESSESELFFILFIGYTAQGWFYSSLEKQRVIKVVLGGQTIGIIEASLPFVDEKNRSGIETNIIGFEAMLGGLLHVSAVANKLTTVYFRQAALGGLDTEINLTSFYQEAYTFAPLKSFSRTLGFPSPGIMRGARCLGDDQFSLLIEAGKTEINGNRIYIYFYQEDTPGKLKAIGQFDIELAGQLIDLEFDLISREQPILIVVTDASHGILLTDCIPYPAIFMPRYKPLVEYHCLLASGRPYFEIASRLTRGYLDYNLTKALGEIETNNSQPCSNNIAVLLFVRGDFDAFPSFEEAYYRHISDRIAFLDHNGMVRKTNGNKIVLKTIQQFIAESEAEFVLLCEIGNSIRPDFWAIMNGQRDRFHPNSSLFYWDSIWLEGSARPYWVKNDLLCHEVFNKNTLAPINAVIVSRELLLKSATLQPEYFRSGRLRPESAFYFIDLKDITYLPVVMDISRLRLASPTRDIHINAQDFIAGLNSLRDTNFFKSTSDLMNLSYTKSDNNIGVGVSIVINYRNSAEVTIQSLQSIRLQRLDAPIELILINNGSSLSSVKAVTGAAIRLFGETNVKAINYNKRFNHSAQCNLGVRHASHEFILMLSNDAILISPNAIARSMEIASIPCVGTCGYRMVGYNNGKNDLQSLGLKIAESKYVFSGGYFFVTERPPAFALDFTLSSVGNTFGAVMLRKAVYEELNGLDEHDFPADFNDVDFCLRASANNYRHIAIGECLVCHSGRGSREENLDLPMNPKIMERLPAIPKLIDNFAIVPL